MERKILGYKTKPEHRNHAFLNSEAPKPLDEYMFYTTPFSIKNFQRAGVLDIWFEPIYEEETSATSDLLVNLDKEISVALDFARFGKKDASKNKPTQFATGISAALEEFYNKAATQKHPLIEAINQWQEDRNFFGEGGATLQSQFIKLSEEMGELAGNIARGKDCRDDIGDIFVVLNGIARLSGTNIYECMLTAYNDIKDRKGKFRDGTFIKEQDLKETTNN